jgi:fumarylpyruvate hydrolase
MLEDGRGESRVFAQPPVVSQPIVGEDAQAPVHRTSCAGRNDAAHVVEMGHDPEKQPPFFFQKIPDNLLIGDGDLPDPDLPSMRAARISPRRPHSIMFMAMQSVWM